jgi:hypothetical protein
VEVEGFSQQIFAKYSISILMKICPVEAKLVLADGGRGKQT